MSFGGTDSRTAKNPHIIYSQLSVSVVPHPPIQPTTDCIGLQYLLLEKIDIQVNQHSLNFTLLKG